MNSADEFLRQKHLFQLGDLPTETPHPKTISLSEWALSDVPRAIETMREIDIEALRKVAGLKNELQEIFHAVADTLEKGDRIFLVGCGATGRLSLSLEYLWRTKHRESDQVVSLMAGGDVALVHSLEGFEDFPEYGARHLLQLGFSENDLVIGSSEGGETPYVIGAVEMGEAHSRRPPLFLYCNTRQVLIDKVDRSRRILTHPRIRSFCLATGPMALTGSTRMQASTVLMLVIGLALEFGRDFEQAFEVLDRWIDHFSKMNLQPIETFVALEAKTYLDDQHTIYSIDEGAITVFTDTTERAPTFNLAPFDNPSMLTDRHSLTYITIPSAQTAEEAWVKLLSRYPRPLNWPEIHVKTSSDYLMSFDFGRGAAGFRQRLIPDKSHFQFKISLGDCRLTFEFRDLVHEFFMQNQPRLFDHLTLKMILNIHSTLVMGRLNRFEGNLMTWVYPSNGKLVDRAARYTQILLGRYGYGEFDYDEIVRAQYACKPSLSPKESIVHNTIKKLINERIRRPESRGPR